MELRYMSYKIRWKAPKDISAILEHKAHLGIMQILNRRLHTQEVWAVQSGAYTEAAKKRWTFKQ